MKYPCDDIEYEKFNLILINDGEFTTHQMEIKKKAIYLSRYIKKYSDRLIVCDANTHPMLIFKIYDMTECKTIDDRFSIYEQALKFVVNEILRKNVFGDDDEIRMISNENIELSSDEHKKNLRIYELEAHVHSLTKSNDELHKILDEYSNENRLLKNKLEENPQSLENIRNKKIVKAFTEVFKMINDPMSCIDNDSLGGYKYY